MSPAMQSLIERIGDVVDQRIRPMFRSEFQAGMHVTVLVRFDDSPDSDVIVTSDNDAGIREIVERRTMAPASGAAE